MCPREVGHFVTPIYPWFPPTVCWCRVKWWRMPASVNVKLYIGQLTVRWCSSSPPTSFLALFWFLFATLRLGFWLSTLGEEGDHVHKRELLANKERRNRMKNNKSNKKNMVRRHRDLFLFIKPYHFFTPKFRVITNSGVYVTHSTFKMHANKLFWTTH